MANPIKPRSEIYIETRDGAQIKVPAEGNLGLLALGYQGIMLWREARAASGWTPLKVAQEARKQFQEMAARSKAAEDSKESKG